MDNPVLFNTFLLASTGPIPIILGSTPATAAPTILASGLRWFLFAASSDPTINAAAPSLSPEEFPAVTEPFSFLNAALKLDNLSIEVLGYMNSSFKKMISSFFL